ncbi:hypothetical protein PAXINDRAFT_103326, partial [Paxillus involutus ATCC 200175]
CVTGPGRRRTSDIDEPWRGSSVPNAGSYSFPGGTTRFRTSVAVPRIAYSANGSTLAPRNRCFT